MYANSEHIEILTALLSKIFKVDYEILEGKVELMPLKVQGNRIGEKKSERDIVVSVKMDHEYKLVLEVNVKSRFYQNIIERNLYYSFQTVGHSLLEKSDYSDITYTILINFNTFYINQENRDVFEEFVLQDKYGKILTEKYKIINKLTSILKNVITCGIIMSMKESLDCTKKI